MGWKILALMMLVLFPVGAMALGGSVSYPDGSPAAGAQVVITGGGEGKTTLSCDAQGRFTLEAPPPAEAFVKVRADGKDHAQVRLPASLFVSGDVAIILPAKNVGKKLK